MRISAKGRYALATAIHMAANYDQGEYLTAISISNTLGISKIYLEQIFSLLKRSKLVHAIKGAQGGYQLARMPRQITALDVLSAIESSLFEKTEDSVSGKAPDIDKAMELLVFKTLDQKIKEILEKISLEDLVTAAEGYKGGDGMMYYI